MSVPITKTIVDGDITIKTYLDGRNEWWKDGVIHRDNDLPALITKTGTKFWYLHGIHGRIDGPATIDPNGTEYWYKEGKLHRVGGPAITHQTGISMENSFVIGIGKCLL